MDGHIDGIQKASCGPFTRAKPSEKPRSHTVQLSGENGRVGSALFSCKHQGVPANDTICLLLMYFCPFLCSPPS